MSRKDYKNEHKKLVRILKKGTNKEQAKEGKDQEEEARKALKTKKKSSSVRRS